MAAGDDDRLEELEILAAHQVRALEELNEVVVRQASEIDRLNRIMEALVERFNSVEQQLDPGPSTTKPPHW